MHKSIQLACAEEVYRLSLHNIWIWLTGTERRAINRCIQQYVSHRNG